MAVVVVAILPKLAASADLVAVLVATAGPPVAGVVIKGVILRLKALLVALRKLIKGVEVVVLVKLEHRGQRRRAIVADLGVMEYRMLMMVQIITMLAVAAAGCILGRVAMKPILREEEVLVVVVLVAPSLAVQLRVVAQEEMLADQIHRLGQAKAAMVVQILVVAVVVKLLEVRAAVPVVLVFS